MNRNLTQKLLAILLVSAPVVLTACDLPVDFWEDKTVTVNLSATDAKSINNTTTVDISDNSAIKSALKTLKNLKIPEVWLQVTKVYDDNKATTATGTATVTDPSDSSWGPITMTYTNVSISQNAKLEITPSASDAVKFAILVQSKHKFTITYGGSVDQVPAHFDLNTKLHFQGDVVPF